MLFCYGILIKRAYHASSSGLGEVLAKLSGDIEAACVLQCVHLSGALPDFQLNFPRCLATTTISYEVCHYSGCFRFSILLIKYNVIVGLSLYIP